MKLIKCAALATMAVAASSCASIVSGGQQDVTINSTPSGASLTIIDQDGVTVYTGATPATVELARGDGFFGKASYIVRVEAPGYGQKEVKLTADEFNAWFLGNFINFTGIIGMAIDGASGAIWKFNPDSLSVPLEAGTAETDLLIVPLDSIDPEDRDKLIPLS